MPKKLPAPRLQLRWQENDGEHGYPAWEHKWICHYELVLPLDKYDIRAEIYKGDRLLKKKKTELVVPIKGPSARSSSNRFGPCTSMDGKERYCDTPYRDGAHAFWDAKVLGNLPIYVIAPDGMTFKHELKDKSHE